ncbi:histidinol-phosphate aminotransferase [Bathymodiolus platifrons methanotrophic gill symbiont]|uniref:histidinol-phosphate transaminase n=1 Tax=Bathymodiolus platifrons methanotrophic gill symbiont TaxID=113268 RepID=UPI000B408FCD|nr:histidinol-phosphate transaminase [Bathymodiolus platifrons methanotrophic gill symbiont]TXK96877.1 histidinol-phosphate transaminase [Methylococcaceae bacterium CS4]TXK98694.1 histidinol-phosphate transaminase [Methylococcaceae bacterium CS5]TXL05154.1 histidinol-phosphate transaminase [Methylococcaceae bacterium CS1]TXL07370.1 histidinol-phosphate transaminase [Methylococcaceae bacterium CS3]TXL09893.1 histidinol-phosphate transaminase [Methylococcaceae bacterium CS2]TXL13818.1 histidino
MSEQEALISAVIRPEIRALTAYKVADAAGYIKLDAMENPYTWPEEIKAEWLKIIHKAEINRYPDPEAKSLCQVLKEYNQIPAQSEILLGNGSDEIIQLLLMALPANSTVMAPEPSFVMYKQIAQCLGLNYQGLPLLADNFELDLAVTLATIKSQQPEIIFLAYPNNPTGNLFDSDAIEQIIQQSKGLVIIDEAYAPFTDFSFINRLTKYTNLLVMRTVSKLGLAGLRLGFIAGDSSIINQLNKARLPYNINILTQCSVEFALSHPDMFDQQTEILCHERARMFLQLSTLKEIEPCPSAANFILFRTAKNKATDIFNSLKEQGVLIKILSPQKGLLSDCLRVTIGKPEENNAFIKALKSAI